VQAYFNLRIHRVDNSLNTANKILIPQGIMPLQHGLKEDKSGEVLPTIPAWVPGTIDRGLLAYIRTPNGVHCVAYRPGYHMPTLPHNQCAVAALDNALATEPPIIPSALKDLWRVSRARFAGLLLAGCRAEVQDQDGEMCGQDALQKALQYCGYRYLIWANDADAVTGKIEPVVVGADQVSRDAGVFIAEPVDGIRSHVDTGLARAREILEYCESPFHIVEIERPQGLGLGVHYVHTYTRPVSFNAKRNLMLLAARQRVAAFVASGRANYVNEVNRFKQL
jgi:hypothetical protein